MVERDCIYGIVLPVAGTCCDVYSHSKRPDKKWWAHWPKCSKENCPLEHPELLEGATFDKEKFTNSQREPKRFRREK